MSTPSVAIEKRDPIVQVLLSFVTCGLYGIYWMIKMNDEVNAVSNHPEAPNGVMVFVYTLLTCGIYNFVWLYNMGKRIEEAKAARGQTSGGGASTTYLILGIFGLGIVSMFLAQQELNSFAEA